MQARRRLVILATLLEDLPEAQRNSVEDAYLASLPRGGLAAGRRANTAKRGLICGCLARELRRGRCFTKVDRR